MHRSLVYNMTVTLFASADVAQAVEHFLGKEEVMGSSPIISSIQKPLNRKGSAVFLLPTKSNFGQAYAFILNKTNVKCFFFL